MQVKKCLVIVNSFKEISKSAGSEIQTFLKERGIQSEIFVFNGEGETCDFEGFDLVITLGGDGTVLFAARACAHLGIPIFPVNFGSFGFIASVQPEEWKEELLAYLAGNAVIDERSMLKAELIKKGEKIFSSVGLNDVVVCGKTAAHTLSFKVSYDNVPLGEIKADGIIVSTATGSTAYSASAGGPIIDPGLDAMTLTLMNSFSLSSRPIVLSPEGMLEIEILYSRICDVVLSVDGQKPNELGVGDIIRIGQTPQKAKLIGATKEKFYNALRSKLNWSGGPRHA